MSTGPGFSGEEPAAGDQPPRVGVGSAARGGDDGTFADVFNGFALDSRRGRRKRKKNKETTEGQARDGNPDEQAALTPPTDQGDRVTSVVSPPGRTDSLITTPGGLFDAGVADSGYPDYPNYRQTSEPDLHPAEETAIVRPYALTGGRTKSNYALELETLVSTKESIAGALSPAITEQVESFSIMEECRTPRSVAEIAAALRVPLGVARVLISDAADAGLVTVHKTITGSDGAEAHLVLMERVLSGLRRL
ncbi:DUF742 domain-containing protein [Amycolatopsis sp.]|jgi:hypothetical protein|uniref:DUF742 domain-containing protein n=1 Tax=Amycolatopsis sp. TaxID=37632 RepID=UPI0026072A2C|nr:DUF742 domain-containing protein [Amycolatopsis sp.]